MRQMNSMGVGATGWLEGNKTPSVAEFRWESMAGRQLHGFCKQLCDCLSQ